eukprot:Hpha_TRINITY_DN15472_c2_g1::TRINITY_DN15472_c2_g1_i1::g.175841::m.175841
MASFRRPSFTDLMRIPSNRVIETGVDMDGSILSPRVPRPGVVGQVVMATGEVVLLGVLWVCCDALGSRHAISVLALVLLLLGVGARAAALRAWRLAWDKRLGRELTNSQHQVTQVPGMDLPSMEQHSAEAPTLEGEAALQNLDKHLGSSPTAEGAVALEATVGHSVVQIDCDPSQRVSIQRASSSAEHHDSEAIHRATSTETDQNSTLALHVPRAADVRLEAGHIITTPNSEREFMSCSTFRRKRTASPTIDSDTGRRKWSDPGRHPGLGTPVLAHKSPSSDHPPSVSARYQAHRSDVASLCKAIHSTLARREGTGGYDSVESSEIAEIQCLDGSSVLLAERVGRGAFGSVYKSLHEQGALCASKVIQLPVVPEAMLTRTVVITKGIGETLGVRIRETGMVTDVIADSPAARAGIESGMAIATIGGDAVVDLTMPPNSQPNLLRDVKPKEEVVLEVVDRESALKFTQAIHSTHEMVQEVVLLGRLVSEFITPLYTCALLPGKMVVVMELATGSLLSLLQEVGPLPHPAIARYTKDMLCGLRYLHLNNVAHADFKTANVLLGVRGDCKLTDFGCSMLCAAPGSNRFKNIVGTPLYLSPEAANGEPEMKSDVWSLGLVVGELFHGGIPYNEDPPKDRWALTMSISLRNLIPVVPEGVPQAAQDFLAQCWVENPAERPSATELMFETFVNGLPSICASTSRSVHVSASGFDSRPSTGPLRSGHSRETAKTQITPVSPMGQSTASSEASVRWGDWMVRKLSKAVPSQAPSFNPGFFPGLSMLGASHPVATPDRSGLWKSMDRVPGGIGGLCSPKYGGVFTPKERSPVSPGAADANPTGPGLDVLGGSGAVAAAAPTDPPKQP